MASTLPDTGGALAADSSSAVSAPTMAAAIGVSLAHPVVALEAVLRKLRAEQPITATQLAELHQGLAQVHSIGLQAQQIGRLAEGSLRQAHEPLSLHEVVLNVLMQAGAPWRTAGVELRHRIRPVEILADPGLLVGLLEAVFGWSSALGRKLLVKLDIPNWPEHGVLVVRSLHEAGAPDTRQPENLAWQLVLHTARAMGLPLRRDILPGYVQLAVEFPRTVPHVTGVAGPESDRWLVPESVRSGRKAAEGEQLLLVTDDARLQREVRDVCTRLRMRCAAVHSVPEARRQLDLALPAVIVIDQYLHDAAFDALREDVLESGLPLPAIEIAREDSGFSLSAWDGRSLSRVGRDRIAGQLEEAITLELSR